MSSSFQTAFPLDKPPSPDRRGQREHTPSPSRSHCSFSLHNESDPNALPDVSQHSDQRRLLMSQLHLGERHDKKFGSIKKHCRERIASSFSEIFQCKELGDRPAKDDGPIIQQRVSAASRVNFAHLTEEEQIIRYRNVRLQYLSLKKKLAEEENNYHNRFRKKQPNKEKKPENTADSLLKEAQEKLKLKTFEELPDCGRVLENLAECLASGAMKTNSLEFGLLCNLVRKVKMGLSSREGLSLMTEANALLKQSTKEELIQFMKGKAHKIGGLVKPVPVYSSNLAIPFSTQHQVILSPPGMGKANSSVDPQLVAQTVGRKVKIIQHQTNATRSMQLGKIE